MTIFDTLSWGTEILYENKTWQIAMIFPYPEENIQYHQIDLINTNSSTDWHYWDTLSLRLTENQFIEMLKNKTIVIITH